MILSESSHSKAVAVFLLAIISNFVTLHRRNCLFLSVSNSSSHRVCHISNVFFKGKVRIWSSFERLRWEPRETEVYWAAELWQWEQEHRGLFLLCPAIVCSSLCEEVVGPEAQSVASACREENGLVVAREYCFWVWASVSSWTELGL